MPNDEKVEDFLEHYGVKGMKWGQRKDRRVARVQARIDRTKRVADKQGTVGDRLRGMAVTSRGAKNKLQRSANAQAKYAEKVAAGKKKTNEKVLNKVGAVKITDVNYHTKGDPDPKLTRGEKATLAIVATYGAVKLHKALVRRAVRAGQ